MGTAGISAERRGRDKTLAIFRIASQLKSSDMCKFLPIGALCVISHGVIRRPGPPIRAGFPGSEPFGRVGRKSARSPPHLRIPYTAPNSPSWKPEEALLVVRRRFLVSWGNLKARFHMAGAGPAPIAHATGTDMTTRTGETT